MRVSRHSSQKRCTGTAFLSRTSPSPPRSERVMHMYETKIRNTIFVMLNRHTAEP